MKTAKQLFEAAFGTPEKPSPRSPRSEAYKLGVLNQLRYRLLEIDEFPRLYKEGTAESDAYSAGVNEAWGLLRSTGISPDPRKLREDAKSASSTRP